MSCRSARMRIRAATGVQVRDAEPERPSARNRDGQVRRAAGGEERGQDEDRDAPGRRARRRSGQRLGANPTPLPFPEVYAALDQKAIDGQENPPTVISANKLYEVQKHIVLSNHQYNPQSLIFSKKVWDTLSAADRKLLIDAGVEAGKYQRQVSRDAATTALENLKKNGMQVTELSAVELAKLREKMNPVIAKHSEVVGAETVSALQGELAKLRK